jgi:hypothetical protein
MSESTVCLYQSLPRCWELIYTVRLWTRATHLVGCHGHANDAFFFSLFFVFIWFSFYFLFMLFFFLHF